MSSKKDDAFWTVVIIHRKQQKEKDVEQNPAINDNWQQADLVSLPLILTILHMK